MSLMQVTTEEWDGMIKMFGKKTIPNPEIYPKSFDYYYRIYKLMKYDSLFAKWRG